MINGRQGTGELKKKKKKKTKNKRGEEGTATGNKGGEDRCAFNGGKNEYRQ